MSQLSYPANLLADNIPYILFQARPYITKLEQTGSQDPSTSDYIRLAIPPQLTAQDGFNYDTTSLLKTEALSNFMNGEFADSAKGALAALMQEVGGIEGLKNATQAMSGKSTNPKEELLFKSPTLRSHSFNFNLFARSEDEAKLITNIIKKFRELIYPTTVTDSGNSFYQFPHEFSISQHPFSDGGNGFPPIPNAVCTSMESNFAGGGRTVLTKDDYFQAIDLTITFQDLRTMTSKSITSPIDRDGN